MLTISTESNDEDRISLENWQLLAQVGQMFRSAADTFSDQVDVPRGQAGLLCVIARKDGMTQSEIAEELSVQGATVTKMLQRLEEAGLVARQRDADDNRLVRVYLTDEGRTKEQALNAQFGEMQALLFKGMSAEEQATLRRQLHQVVANLTESS